MPHCPLISNSYKERGNLTKKLNSNRALIFWFEYRKKGSFGLKITSFPKGPTISLSVENFYTFMNINFLGNGSKWSRPILTFDESFNRKPHLRIFRFIFSQVFWIKSKKKQSEAFFDHVIAFFEVNSEIHFRVYQLKTLTQSTVKKKKEIHSQLIEIGPRITFSLIRIWGNDFQRNLFFDSSFS